MRDDFSQRTKDGLQEHDGIRELVHGKVYSDIFKQIIVLAASEFEIMSKALCSAKGVKTKRSFLYNSNIGNSEKEG